MNTSSRTFPTEIANARSAVLKTNIARLKTDIESKKNENEKLQLTCRDNTAVVKDRRACADKIAENEGIIYNNEAQIRTFKSQLTALGVTLEAGRRKTLKGRRKQKQNKSRRNRKSRR
jgi:hypothetical protein